MNIYIPIEVKARELEGRGLLAIIAAERGHNVIIGEKKDTNGLAKSGLLPPGIVHMKSITPSESKINLLLKLSQHGHKITIQDEESGIADHSYDSFAKLRFSEESLSYVTKVFAWGDYDGLALRQIFSNFSEKIAVTGSPRVDFWRSDFKYYYNNFKDDPLLYDKPFILVVSNFSSFLNENRFWNILARLHQAGYFEREKHREQHEYENAAYQTLMIGKFVEMIRSLSLTFPNYNIIVRPHPVESIEGWKRIIGDYPNIIVKRDGTISRWIRFSKCIIHNGCTSAMEAAISDKFRIAYRPIPNELERPIPNLMSVNTNSLDELQQILSDFFSDKKSMDLNDVQLKTNKYISERFINSKGKLAAERIVDEWEKIGKKYKLQQNEVSDFHQILKNQKPTFFQKVKNVIYAKLKSQSGNANNRDKTIKYLNTQHKFEDLKSEEFEKILDSLRSTFDRFHNVTFERYGKKSFIVTRKD